MVERDCGSGRRTCGAGVPGGVCRAGGDDARLQRAVNGAGAVGNGVDRCAAADHWGAAGRGASVRDVCCEQVAHRLTEGECPGEWTSTCWGGGGS